MKKLRSKKLWPLPNFTPEEIKQAIQWINNLTQDEKRKFELLARVQLAQKLMKEYIRQEKRNRTQTKSQ